MTTAAEAGASKKRTRTPWWSVALISFGVLIVLGSVGVYAFVNKALDVVNKSVATAPLLTDAPAPPVVQGNPLSGPLNLLIVGLDASDQRTDTIIMAHIPASHDKIYLVSIPRDTRVNQITGGTNKINGTYVATKKYASPMSNLAATIDLNWGITFNAGLIVNFDGFKDIVDKLGGVTMYVDETTYSIHHGYLGNDPNDHAAPYVIDPQTGVPECSKPHTTWNSDPSGCTIPGRHEVIYPKGLYTFDSYDALDYVRARDGLTGIDYARQRHQQQFIKALLETAYSEGLSNPTKAFGFIEAIGQAFTFEGRGTSISDWVFTLKGITPDNLVTIKTNDGEFVSPPPGSPPDGAGSEQALNDLSKELFDDVKNDTGDQDLVGQFLDAHPDWNAAADPNS